MRSFASIIFPEDREYVNDVVDDRSSRGGSFSVEYRLSHADGTERWVARARSVVVGRDGRPHWIDGVIIELSRQKEADPSAIAPKRQLLHQAGHDAVTGLPNRTLVLDRAEQMLLRSTRDHHLVGAFCVDLDNFKFVNDTLGARDRRRAVEVGGGPLRRRPARERHGRAARRRRVRDPGGRGFALLLDRSFSAERLMEVLREPFHIEGLEDIPLSISASIGIATNDREPPHDLLRDANIALLRPRPEGGTVTSSSSPR